METERTENKMVLSNSVSSCHVPLIREANVGVENEKADEDKKGYSYVRTVPSFREVLAYVRLQICLTDKYKGLYGYNEMLAEEIAKIMTEVYLMRDESNIIISGETIPGYLVKAVYREIDCENVRYVCDRFCNLKKTVLSKKAYLRAALYNSVFETESGIINEVNVALARRES